MDFEKVMLKQLNDLYNKAIAGYAILQKQKAPQEHLEKAANQIKKLQDKICKVEMNMNNF
jgi:hypothetical protein